MKRISVSLDDLTAATLRQQAGGAASAWIAGVVRRQLLADACAAAADYDRQHDDPDGEAARLAGNA